jgi:DNA polymerase III epsilon subunit family exonuclease
VSSARSGLSPAEVLEAFPRATFAALDFETTGLDPAKDRIVEIGALRFDAAGERETLSLLVNPGMPISPGASRVNGITDEMVASCRPVGELIPVLAAFLEGAVIVAHNAPFDVSFLKEAVKRGGLKGKRYKVADTRLLARAAYPGLPSYSLQSLIKILSIDPGKAHRALDDARACMRLFLLCVGRFGESRTSGNVVPQGPVGSVAP